MKELDRWSLEEKILRENLRAGFKWLKDTIKVMGMDCFLLLQGAVFKDACHLNCSKCRFRSNLWKTSPLVRTAVQWKKLHREAVNLLSSAHRQFIAR